MRLDQRADWRENQTTHKQSHVYWKFFSNDEILSEPNLKVHRTNTTTITMDGSDKQPICRLIGP